MFFFFCLIQSLSLSLSLVTSDPKRAKDVVSAFTKGTSLTWTLRIDTVYDRAPIAEDPLLGKGLKISSHALLWTSERQSKTEVRQPTSSVHTSAAVFSFFFSAMDSTKRNPDASAYPYPQTHIETGIQMLGNLKLHEKEKVQVFSQRELDHMREEEKKTPWFSKGIEGQSEFAKLTSREELTKSQEQVKICKANDMIVHVEFPYNGEPPKVKRRLLTSVTGTNYLFYF